MGVAIVSAEEAALNRLRVQRAPLLQIVDVVPPVLGERVGHQGRTEQVADLAAGHAVPDLVDRRLVEIIALLDVDAIDTGGRQGTQGHAQQQTVDYVRQYGALPTND